jgi:hypothetical protein
LRELGHSLGVSAERVRQLEQGALEKMRSAYGDRRPNGRAPSVRPGHQPHDDPSRTVAMVGG